MLFVGILELIVGVIYLYLYINSKKNKYEGKLVIEALEEGKTMFSLELDENLDNLMNMQSVLFKVENKTDSQSIHPL